MRTQMWTLTTLTKVRENLDLTADNDFLTSCVLLGFREPSGTSFRSVKD